MGLLILTFGALCGLASAQATRTISFPASRPSNAVTAPADFVGFGFEAAFLNQYDNQFSNNLVDSVAKRMSRSPIIRIGGTSGDLVRFDGNQEPMTVCVKGDCPNGSNGHFILGRNYFDGFKGFPNARFTFQAPLGMLDTANHLNVSNTLHYVRQAYQAAGANRVAAIAIGNEVNNPGYYTVLRDYLEAVRTLEDNITSALGLSGSDAKIFEVLDIASGRVDQQLPWTLPRAFDRGINANGLIKVAAEHWYTIGSKFDGEYDLQSQLMNHTAVTDKFINHDKSVTYLRSHGNIPYIISESGTALGGGARYSDYFGAALGYIDFQLYAMSKGVRRISSTQRPAAAHSLWIPVSGIPGSAGPSVRAPYYAQPLIADFVSTATTPTGVINMDLKSDKLTAYAAYDGTDLARIVLINLQEWSRTSGRQRGSQKFAIKMPKEVRSVKVARFQAEAGAEAGGFDIGGQGENITYAGEQWSYKVDNGKGHRSGPLSEAISVIGDTIVVDVPSSEAVFITV